MECLESSDIRYPWRLLSINDLPKKLYVEGDLKNLNTNCIAVVGSRECTDYGIKWCRAFVKELVKYDLTIVSGMAIRNRFCCT